MKTILLIAVIVLCSCKAYDPKTADKTTWVPIYGLPNATPLFDEMEPSK